MQQLASRLHDVLSQADRHSPVTEWGLIPVVAGRRLERGKSSALACRRQDMAHDCLVGQPNLGSLMEQKAVLLQIGPRNDATEDYGSTPVPPAKSSHPAQGKSLAVGPC